MISKAKIKQLERKWSGILDSKGGRTIVVKENSQGQWATLDDRLLTKEEIGNINEDCKNLDKQLIVLIYWGETSKNITET